MIDGRDSYLVDKDGLRRQDVSALSGNPFNEFYNRLRTLREYHRKHPDEVATPLSVQVAAYAKVGTAAGGAVDDETLLASFTDEESQGRFLDLHAIFEKYLNLKGVKEATTEEGKELDYYSYLKKFDQLFDIKKDTKSTAAYR